MDHRVLGLSATELWGWSPGGDTSDFKCGSDWVLGLRGGSELGAQRRLQNFEEIFAVVPESLRKRKSLQKIEGLWSLCLEWVGLLARAKSAGKGSFGK